MWRRVCSIAVAVAAVWVSQAAGQPGGQATGQPGGQAAGAAPATSPAATQEADSTTPRGTLTLLSRAQESGNAVQIRELLQAGGPNEQKMIDSLAERTEAYGKLYNAIKTQFGQEKADELTGRAPQQAAQAEAAIAAAEVNVQGDTATVNLAGQPITLKKVGDKWMLSVTGLAQGMEAADIDKALEDMRVMNEIVSNAANDVTSGKYKSAEEVGEAIKSKMMAIMLSRTAQQGGATQPATGEAPTTAPSGH